VIRIPILRPGAREAFPDAESALDEPNGLLAAGGDLATWRLLEAYRQGIFPWFSADEPLLWWSPDPRMVFDTNSVHVTSRLRRWLRTSDWAVEADRDFTGVMRACAAPRAHQPTTWITDEMLAAYAELHALGHAHSIEVYDAGQLVGGIYGVAVGRMFFGESMFSKRTNGSKVALIALCRGLHQWQFPLLDAQVSSSHLVSMGAHEMRRKPFVATVAALTGQEGVVGRWSEKWQVREARALA